MSVSSTTTSNGKKGCKCKDVRDTLASFTERACTFESEDGEVQTGVLLKANANACMPHSFGSNECRQYEMLYDTRCRIGFQTGNVPRYCVESWCYVDRELCKLSNETIYRSNNFPSLEADLFYSYTTCNSTADAWLDLVKTNSEAVLHGVSFFAGMPDMQVPYFYKSTASGETTAETGAEYFNDSIPFEGIYVQYIETLLQIAGDDIGNFSYTHGSIASRSKYPDSSYNAMVDDIEQGIVQISPVPFWITAHRLKKVSFTIPLIYDKTVLVIPSPGSTYSLSYESAKVFGPFTLGMWLLVLLIIVVSALLSVWFTDGNLGKGRLSKRKKLRRYCRSSFDEILEKGTFFFSGGVEQDSESSLPHKLLMFGFGFFILIAVSAYVANLAAFLTRQMSVTTANTMKEAVAANIKICAHPAIKEELLTEWPDGNFVFDESGSEWYGLVDMYEANKCSVLVVGQNEIMLDPTLSDRFCSNDLYFTDSVALEIPMAFPIRSDLASGFSYWIYHADRNKDVSLMTIRSEHFDRLARKSSCSAGLFQKNKESQDEDEFVQISPANMILPIICFAGFAIGAVILQIYYEKTRKRGRGGTWIGRPSSLRYPSLSSMDNDVSTNDLFPNRSEKNATAACMGSNFSGNADQKIPDDSFHENGTGVDVTDSTCKRVVSWNIKAQEMSSDVTKET